MAYHHAIAKMQRLPHRCPHRGWRASEGRLLTSSREFAGRHMARSRASQAAIAASSITSPVRTARVTLQAEQGRQAAILLTGHDLVTNSTHLAATAARNSSRKSYLWPPFSASAKLPSLRVPCAAPKSRAGRGRRLFRMPRRLASRELLIAVFLQRSIASDAINSS